MSNQLHSPAWLESVRLPGPNKTFFSDVPDVADASIQHVGTLGYFIMEDDTEPSQFTPGCGAYAGYTSGPYANMAVVREYATSQHAVTFSYSGQIGELAGAEAFDIEPGLGVPSDAPAAYRAGVRYFYASASEMAQVKGVLAAAALDIRTCKWISAHYIGSHICGPATCGYTQATATQFSENYLGRTLDGTLCPVDFFGNIKPADLFPLKPGDSGTIVAAVQKLLNKWGSILHTPTLVTDGQFGAATETAVKIALQHWDYSSINILLGEVPLSLYQHMSGPLPSQSYPAPSHLKVLAAGAHSVKVVWSPPVIPPGLSSVIDYDLFIRKNSVLVDGYPREGIRGTSIQEGGLEPDTEYVLSLVATGPNGANFAGSKAANVSFKTAA